MSSSPTVPVQDTTTQKVRKRDGTTLQPFDVDKLRRAIHAAWLEVEPVNEKALTKVIRTVTGALLDDVVDVETVQDAVETALMRLGHFGIAKCFILYRQQRTEARQGRVSVPVDPLAISNYIHAAKYARFLPEEGRREVYEETVSRVENMHLRRFPALAADITWAFDRVREKRVLPSMRSLENSTPIPTPDGWKTVGDVKVGDTIFDQDGEPTTVLGVEKFYGIDLFDVHFSDKSTLRASADHLWVTSTLDDRIVSRRRVVSTEQISKTIRQGSGNALYPWKYNHAVWNPSPLKLSTKELPLDPYILGLWLGDGYSHGGQFACHWDDAEIPAAYDAAGFPTTVPGNGNPYAWGTHGLATILRTMGLRDNKHVPEIYLRASQEQRLALVQGLMDSDGHTTPEGRSHFHNRNPRILEGMQELLSSLGIKFGLYKTKRRLPHHKDGYNICFFSDLQVHRLTRKKDNLRTDHRNANRYRTIVGVEPAGKGDAACFLVSAESHTYLAGRRMIVTHNCMQFGGSAIEQNNNRMFNCTATLIDRIEAFSQALYLLLCGCGVGYSVQFEHVEQLPPIAFVDSRKIRHHVIADTIEGWADALKALLQGYQDGEFVEFAYHLIRSEGSVLKTSGGRAPGHTGLKTALERIRKVLDGAQGRKLRSVECHRILCHAADAVLSGGVRRSAMLAMFSLEDSEMMQIKTGNWFASEPWLANANNSVALKRDEIKKKAFKRIFQMTKQWGEPGFLFVDDYRHIVNPCSEVSFLPVLTITDQIKDRLADRGVSVRSGDIYTGWSMCNLTEINAAKFESVENMMTATRAATIIGTLQASYMDMPYLGWVSEELAKRDALLGVSMTGMFDAPSIALNAQNQRDAATKATEWNAEFASKIGIEPAARVTVIKPAGTSSLELGGVASGHHPHHARRYIRRVTAVDTEPVFQAFKAINPHMCVRKPDGKWIIEFPVEAPTNAIVKDDVGAIQFLEMVKSTQQNWILPGTTRAGDSKGLHNNVSNTVVVKPEEWDDVAEYLWDNREFFTGVSLLPSFADKQYAYAPLESVTTPADEARWNAILASYKPVDYTALFEADDATNLKGEAACAGGACSIV